MAEKELYEFSELCMFEVFIHVNRKFYVGKENVDDSRSTQEVCQAVKNIKQEWKVVNGNVVTFETFIAIGGEHRCEKRHYLLMSLHVGLVTRYY